MRTSSNQQLLGEVGEIVHEHELAGPLVDTTEA
jgi:hypothetical protein